MSKVTYTYTLPERLAKDSGYKTVTLAPLTVEDEQIALKRCFGEPLRIAAECSKQSLRAVDERSVTDGDASLDQAWERLGSAGRRLITHAYSKLNQPEQNEYEDFMKSQAVVVG